MIFGVVIGTYSSIFIAAPVLIYLGVKVAARPRPPPSRRQGRRQGAPSRVARPAERPAQ